MNLLKLLIVFLLMCLGGCAPAKNSLVVTSTPEGADVRLDGKICYAGGDQIPDWSIAGKKTPATFEYIGSCREKVVTLSKTGFETVSKVVHGNPLHIKLEEKLNFSDIFVSTPSGADVYCIDDRGVREYFGNTPFRVEYKGNMKTSNFLNCTANAEGFNNSSIEMNGDTRGRYFGFILEKGFETIYEEITSYPSGAKIYWGENKEKLVYSGQKTPYKIKISDKYPVIPSKFYKVKLAGYFDSDIKFKPKTNKTRAVSFDLVKNIPGTLDITSDQSNIEIYLNDRLVGRTTETPLHLELERGEYTLLGKKNGYENQVYNLLVEASGKYQKHFNLKKIIYGAVKFTSNIGDVDIYIDGILKGRITKKPFVAKLPVGTYAVMAKKELFGAKTINLTIEPYDSFSYNFELKEAGNLAEEMGTGKIVQSTGELILFTGRNDLDITILGRKYIPPATIPNMASGKYKASLRGPGFTKNIEIVVKEGGRSIVDLDELLE